MPSDSHGVEEASNEIEEKTMEHFLGEKWHETTSNNYYLAHNANNVHTLAPSPYVRFRGKRLCL